MHNLETFRDLQREAERGAATPKKILNSITSSQHCARVQ